MSRQFFAALAGVAALAMLIGGCGGSDDGDSTATASITKAEFIKQGDAICVRGGKEFIKSSQQYAKEHDNGGKFPSEAERQQAVVDVMVPLVRSEAQELKALGSPEGEAEEVEALIVALNTAADEVEKNPKLVYDSKTNSFTKAGKQLARYGLKACDGP